MTALFYYAWEVLDQLTLARTVSASVVCFVVGVLVFVITRLGPLSSAFYGTCEVGILYAVFHSIFVLFYTPEERRRWFLRI